MAAPIDPIANLHFSFSELLPIEADGGDINSSLHSGITLEDFNNSMASPFRFSTQPSPELATLFDNLNQNWKLLLPTSNTNNNEWNPTTSSSMTSSSPPFAPSQGPTTQHLFGAAAAVSAPPDDSVENSTQRRDASRKLRYCQMCWAAFCIVFDREENNGSSSSSSHISNSSTAPPLAAVMALWCRVVLPRAFVDHDDYQSQAEQMAQEVWHTLHDKLNYVTLLDHPDNGGEQQVRVTHAVYHEYGCYLAQTLTCQQHQQVQQIQQVHQQQQVQQQQKQQDLEEDDDESLGLASFGVASFGIASFGAASNKYDTNYNHNHHHPPKNEDVRDAWRRGFAECLQQIFFEGDADIEYATTTCHSSSPTAAASVQQYAAHSLIGLWLKIDVDRAGALLRQPAFMTRFWQLLATDDAESNPLPITLLHVAHMEQYLQTLDEQQQERRFTTNNNNTKHNNNNNNSAQHVHHRHYNNHHHEHSEEENKWQEALCLYQGWYTILQQQVDDIVIDSSCFLGRSDGMVSDVSLLDDTQAAEDEDDWWGGEEGNYSAASPRKQSNVLRLDLSLRRNSLGSTGRRMSNGSSNSWLNEGSCHSRGHIGNGSNHSRGFVGGGDSICTGSRGLSRASSVMGPSATTGRTNNRRSKAAKVRRRRKRARGAEPQNPLPVLIVGRCLSVMAESMAHVLVELDEEDSTAMVALWRKQAEFITRAMESFLAVMELVDEAEKEGRVHSILDPKLLWQVTLVLSARVWVLLSKCVGTLEENELGLRLDVEYYKLCFDKALATRKMVTSSGNQEDGVLLELVASLGLEKKQWRPQCLQVALVLLNVAGPQSLAETDFLRLYDMLNIWSDSIYADTTFALGLVLFNRKDYSSAGAFFKEVVNRLRSILNLLLRKEELPKAQSFQLFAVWNHSSSPNTGDLRCKSMAKQLVAQLCVVNESITTKQHIREIELLLSKSLEYKALALHLNSFCMEAVAWLQEAIAFRVTHLGTYDLEVARLNGVAGSVYDDLMLWKAGLERHRRSLDIMMRNLSKLPMEKWFSEHESVFLGVVEVLERMGQSYRMLDDFDNAIGCYWKIAMMMRKQWEALSTYPEAQTKFTGFNLENDLSVEFDELRLVPLPAIVLEEERYAKRDVSLTRNANVIVPPRTPLVHLDDASLHSSSSSGVVKEDAILCEIAQGLQAVTNLFKEKANTCLKTGTVPSTLTGLESVVNALPDSDIPILLFATHKLGLIHMHFREYKSAIPSLELCLRCLWVLDGGNSSSDESSSDNDDEEDSAQKLKLDSNRKIRHKRLKEFLAMFEIDIGFQTDELDEGSVYHSLGLCHYACGEHDQAVRYHLTALRYARKYHGSNSAKVAEILYDAGTCYWYMMQYEKACDFWTTCLQNSITNSHHGQSERRNMEYARTVYNVGASLCAMGRFSDPRVTALLTEAEVTFSSYSLVDAQLDVANCYFYLALAQSKLAKGKREELMGAADKLRVAASIYGSLGHFHGFEVDLDGSSEVRESVPRVPCILRAHFSFLNGTIREAMGHDSTSLASYDEAAVAYQEHGDQWALHEAAVMQAMGGLLSRAGHHVKAMEALEKSLELRLKHLGRDHEAVGETLYVMAEFHADLGHLDVAMQMHREVLRVRLLNEGDRSPSVALSLLKVGSIYARDGLYEPALETLQAAISIRRDRIECVSRAIAMSNHEADNMISLSSEPQLVLDDDKDQVLQALTDDMAKAQVDLGILLHCIGNLHVQLQEWDKAIHCYEEALSVRKGRAQYADGGDGIKVEVADTFHNLGCVYELLMDYKSALDFFGEALRLKHITDQMRDASSSSSTTTTTDMVSISNRDTTNQRRTSIDWSKRSLSYASTLQRMGNVHVRMNNIELAVTCLETALQIQETHLGMNHEQVAVSISELADALRQLPNNRDEEALEYYKQAFLIRKQLRSTKGDEYGSLCYRMGSIYLGQQDYTRAGTLYRKAVHIYGKLYVDSISRCLLNTTAMFLPSVMTTKSSFANHAVTPAAKARIEKIVPPKFVGDRERAARELYQQASSGLRLALSMSRVATQHSSSSSSCGNSDVDEQSITNELIDLDSGTPDCWITMELYIVALLEYWMAHAGRVKTSTRASLQEMIQRFEFAVSDAVITSSDKALFHMMYGSYLIQQ